MVLPGSIFGLYTKDDIVSEDGTVLIRKDTLIETKQGGANGSVYFESDLPLGWYYVKELMAPYGYTAYSGQVDINASARDDGRSTIYIAVTVSGTADVTVSTATVPSGSALATTSLELSTVSVAMVASELEAGSTENYGIAVASELGEDAENSTTANENNSNVSVEDVSSEVQSTDTTNAAEQGMVITGEVIRTVTDSGNTTVESNSGNDYGIAVASELEEVDVDAVSEASSYKEDQEVIISDEIVRNVVEFIISSVLEQVSTTAGFSNEDITMLVKARLLEMFPS
jgi:hypothetical protein